MGFKSKTKVAPTHYPKLPFHALRSVQLVSSLIVGAITFFFDWHLRHDKWNIPWTFIVLTATSCLTILILTSTILLHCFTGLNPRLNILLNLSLVCLWGLGFGLLSWWARDTLTHGCTVDKWHDSQGVMVCQIYKALFTFSFAGFVSTIAALTLDIYVFKRATARGKYDAMHDPQTETKRAFDPSYRDSMDSVRASVDNGGAVAPGTPQGIQALKGQQRSGGYAVPREQFSDDTAYRGAGGN